MRVNRPVQIFFTVLIACCLAAIPLLGPGMALFYTDYLWFDSLARTDVWQQVLLHKVLLVAVLAVIFAVVLWVNLLIAQRLSPYKLNVLQDGDDTTSHMLKEAITKHPNTFRLLVSTLLSVFAVLGVHTQWEKWILFANRQNFGIQDPHFNTDIGFYVFQLPFLSFFTDWLFSAMFTILLVTSLLYMSSGGLRIKLLQNEWGGVYKSIKTPDKGTLPSVKAHISVILAVLALIRAFQYWLERFELTISTRGVVDGALYTDVKAKLPVLNLLLMISVFAVVLLLVNMRRKGWTLPILSVGLWAFVALVAGNLYPSFVQRFQVEPNETQSEAIYTGRNISSTRNAYGLTVGEGGKVEEKKFAYDDAPTAQQIRNSRQTLRNARLLDPHTLTDTFNKDQSERDFYGFPHVLDVDRYNVDGELTQVVLAARELNFDASSSSELSSWERQHVAITHGYGLAMAKANVTTSRGSPEFVVGKLPVEIDTSRIDINLEKPQIYVGENMSGYALVGATSDGEDYAEVDYVDGSGQEVIYEGGYTGDGGVNIGSLLRRLAFALRFAQLDPLISDYIKGDTKVIYIRDVRERVQRIAPFLHLDSDIYPAVHNGRIHYIVDAYTTTDRYPYSQRADISGLSAISGLNRRNVNYIRNSVKAVVDAYTGDVKLYITPGDDPIIEAWRSAFPKLFSDFTDLPEELKNHLRFPNDMFTVLTNMWAKYQVSDPKTFIIGTESWAVAQDPGTGVSAGGATETRISEEGVISRREQRVSPYYSLIQLPEEDDTSFVALRTFVPVSQDDGRKELTAFMAGETKPDGESRLISYKMSDLTAPGPAIVASNISTNPEISKELTLLNEQGSTVLFGDMLLLPVENSILYVRPMYVQAQVTQIPLLARVIVSVGDRTAMGQTLSEALSALYEGEDFTDIVLTPDSLDGHGQQPQDTANLTIDTNLTTDNGSADMNAQPDVDVTDEPSLGEPSDANNTGVTDDVTSSGSDTLVAPSSDTLAIDALTTKLFDLSSTNPQTAEELSGIISQLVELLNTSLASTVPSSTSSSSAPSSVPVIPVEVQE